MHHHNMEISLTGRAGPKKPSSCLSEAFYARSCIRTSENSYSTHLGE
jgi:hypothetical protein